MAQIREELVLADKFSTNLAKYTNMTQDASVSTKQLRAAAARARAETSLMTSASRQSAAASRADAAAKVAASKQARAAAQANTAAINQETAAIRLQIQQQRLAASAARDTKGATDQLNSSIRRLVASLLSIQAVKSFVSLADNLTSINARLNMMNDGLQTTAELNQMIMDSANRTGGAYQDTANLVSKLGVLAGNAFSSSAETVAFAEQVNKLMAIAGTSTEGASAAMLQLTQAMASGVLRGEELNSVLEQAPTIAQTIAKYLGVNVGELRNMASEGQITANVVKNALLGMADETNAAFEQMPLTFGRIGNRIGNAFISAVQPAISKLNEFLASDTGQEMVEGFVNAATVIGNVVGGIIDILSGLAEFISNNFSTVMVAAGVVVAAFAGYLLAMAAAAIAANWPIVAIVGGVLLLSQVLSALGITGAQVLAGLGSAFGTIGAIAYNAFAIIYNAVATVADFLATAFTDPIAAIVGLFTGLADTVLSILSTIAGAIDAIFGSNLQSAVEGWRSSLSGWVDDKFGDRVTKTERLELMSVADTAGDVAKAFSDFGSGLGETFGGTSGGVNYGEEIAANTASTAGSAGSIEKSLGLAEEDIKSLVDVAEQRYVNRINLTAQSPVINITGANTGNTPADRQRLADQIRDVLVEQISSGSSRATTYAVSGA